MKASFNKIERKVTAFILGKMGMFIKEIFMPIFAMEKEKCSGLMARSIKEIGWSTNPMEKVLFLMEWNKFEGFFKMEN